MNKWAINFFANSGGESQDGGNNKLFDYKYDTTKEPKDTKDLNNTYILFNKLKKTTPKLSMFILTRQGHLI